MILIVSLLFLSTAFAIYIYAYGQADHAQKADVIIILGGGVDQRGIATERTARRVKHAAALYKEGFASYLLCTGGFESSPQKSEASACQDMLQALGVPYRTIFLDENSNSTEENAIESHKIMQVKGFKTAVLVTDNFHIFRSEMLFQRQGLTVYTSPAQVTVGTLDIYPAVFFAYREVVALVWQAVKSALGLPYTHSPL